MKGRRTKRMLVGRTRSRLTVYSPRPLFALSRVTFAPVWFANSCGVTCSCRLASRHRLQQFMINLRATGHRAAAMATDFGFGVNHISNRAVHRVFRHQFRWVGIACKYQVEFAGEGADGVRAGSRQASRRVQDGCPRPSSYLLLKRVLRPARVECPASPRCRA